jgi:hypothetical protein
VVYIFRDAQKYNLHHHCQLWRAELLDQQTFFLHHLLIMQKGGLNKKPALLDMSI